MNYIVTIIILNSIIFGLLVSVKYFSCALDFNHSIYKHDNNVFIYRCRLSDMTPNCVLLKQTHNNNLLSWCYTKMEFIPSKYAINLLSMPMSSVFCFCIIVSLVEIKKG